jgi:ferredoxin
MINRRDFLRGRGWMLPSELGLRTYTVVQERCLGSVSQVCTVCQERCPAPRAIHFVGLVPVIDATRCTGCGECARVCPAPSTAICALSGAG